mgnify:CR=1 FL=1
MKLIRMQTENGPRAGLAAGDAAVPLQTEDGAAPRNLPLNKKWMRKARQMNQEIERSPEKFSERAVPLSEVELLPPVHRPGKVVCLGLNYRDHAEESGMDVPEEPVVFSKAASIVTGPGSPIVLPEVSDKIDYEVEMALVIGREGKSLSPALAAQHIAGYTVLNDVSARDYQHETPGGQWFLGKSFDTFCPLGPWIVTPDEVGDPHDLDISTTVNGETLQNSSTSRMVFQVGVILAYISRVFTLEPGDVIATGTPAGVGFGRTPPRFLESGDTVRCTVENIGTLANPVVEADSRKSS